MTPRLNRVALTLSRRDFDLALDMYFPERGITVLSGPSGSGKTTVLRCVAGLERGARGLVSVQSHRWQDSDASVFLPTWKRPIGYVFQEASLFEHMDVRNNLEFGITRVKSASSRKALDDAIELLGIQSLLKRRPDELSGGERQRVAIARALATQPELLLLDEPLSALDQARRQEIFPWLERIRDEFGTPMLYVTHSIDEIARLADYVVVMDRGRISCSGPAAQVFASLSSPVSTWDEVSVLIDGRIAARDPQWNLLRVDFDGGAFWVSDSGLEVTQFSTLAGLVANGFGISVVPQFAVRLCQRPGLETVPVSDRKAQRPVYMVRRRQRSLSVAAKAMWEQLLRAGKTAVPVESPGP